MAKITDEDVILLSHLRSDARKKVTDISKSMDIPATTIYDKLRQHKKNDVINRYVALLNFSKFGYDIRTHFVIRVKHDAKEQVERFLLAQPHINTLYRIAYLYDFFGEALFRSRVDEETFFGMLSSNFPVLDIQTFKTEKELKQQAFLTRPEHVLLQR